MKEKLKKIPKLYYFISLAGIVCILSIAIPTVARYRNRALLSNTDIWNGSTASSYHAGTGSETDPYIISNGAELSYFSKMLLTEDYANTYFRLSDNILLNPGTFKYDEENGIQYIENGTTYYIKEYTNELYMTKDRSGNTEKTIFFFPALHNFKGHFDGSSYTIYGLYISSLEEEVSLFPNLEGEVHDVYVSNALIYGGKRTAGIASTLTNSTLKNVSYDGFVIGEKDIQKKTSTIDIENQTIDFVTENEIKQNLNINIPFLEGTITKVTLSGTCNQTANDGTIQINGETVTDCNGSNFEIEMGSSPSTELLINSSITENQEVTLSNLKYTITYQTGIAGGIVGVSNNSTLHNVINKSYVSSNSLSSGLIASATGTLKVENSYNVGTIQSPLTSTGLIGTIQGNQEEVKISKSYNAGILEGKETTGLINTILNSKVQIQNSFQAFDSLYAIDTIQNSAVTISNSYHTQGAAIKNGTSEGNFMIASASQLKTKAFITENLQFGEFIDEIDLENNSNHIWILEEGNYPALFIDDLYEPLATIHVSTYSWERFGVKLEPIYFSSQIMFSLEEKNIARPIQSMQYYISKEILSKNQLDQVAEWTTYENVTSITEDGTYVIYGKIIDTEGRTSYLNTELLVLDSVSPSITIQTDNNVWTAEKEGLEYTYIESPTPVTLEAVDDASGIEKLEYFMSDKLLTKEELNALEEWTTYQEVISLDKKGTTIIYTKAIDKAGNIAYVNSDYIIFAGYEQKSLSAGRTPSETLENLIVTNRSTVSLSFIYQDDRTSINTLEHYLVTSALLPEKTAITLIDEKSNKIYQHVVSSKENYQDVCTEEGCASYKYPFKRFQEIGRVGDTGFYEEQKEASKIDEKFNIILDFSNTKNTDSIENMEAYLELRDNTGNKVRSTLKETRRKISLQNDKDATLSIQSTYNGGSIPYNLDSSTSIPLQVGINYANTGEQQIEDSTYENKIMGLAVRLLDEKGNIVPKEQLKNIKFQVGEQTYSPNNDGITRINLQKTVQNLDISLMLITTASSNATLEKGNYSLVIESYASYDGIYATTRSTNSATIQLVVEEPSSKPSIPFTVSYPENGKILSRKEESIKLNWNIQESTGLANTNVRISLYKKNILTAYDQSYSLVDLKEFTNTTLTQALDSTYYLLTKTTSGKNAEVELDINPSKFAPGGYKFVVELFNGENKQISKEEKFIVR